MRRTKIRRDHTCGNLGGHGAIKCLGGARMTSFKVCLRTIREYVDVSARRYGHGQDEKGIFGTPGLLQALLAFHRALPAREG